MEGAESMNKLTLDKQEANKIVWQEHEDWEILEDTVEGGEVYKMMQSFEGVFKHKPTGKFYTTCWGVLHDDWGIDPFDYDKPVFTEVEKITETIVTETWKVVE